MKTERFRDLLDLRGAAVESWPDAEREAARRLLADEPQAEAALAEAERLERLLARLPRDAADDSAAIGRVLAALADLPPQRRSFLDRFRSPPAVAGPRAFWPQMAALAAVAGVGVLIGISDLDAAQDSAVGSDVSTLVFGAEPIVVGLAR
jgi:hypothetical protein